MGEVRTERVVWVIISSRERPSYDINEKLITIKRNNVEVNEGRKMYVISGSVWNYLKSRYDSTVAIKKEPSGRITVSMKMEEADETYTPVAISNRSCIMPTPFKLKKIENDEVDESDDDSSESPYNPHKRATIRAWDANPAINSSVSAKDVIIEEKDEDSIKEKSVANNSKLSIRKSQHPQRSSIESSIEEDIWLGSQVAPAVGFANYGYNCYVNAGLQCFLSLSEITGYFLEEEYNKISYTTVIKSRTVCKQLSALYKQIFQYFPPVILIVREREKR